VGNLGLVGVTVHGHQVSGHAVKVYVGAFNRAALWAAYDLMRPHKLAGQAYIIGGLLGTLDCISVEPLP